MARKQKRFKRPCRSCGIIFEPSGKFERVCSKCRYKRYVGASKKVYTSKRTHDCPFLEMSKYCTNKNRHLEIITDKARCIHTHPKLCKHYTTSTSNLVLNELNVIEISNDN